MMHYYYMACWLLLLLWPTVAAAEDKQYLYRSMVPPEKAHPIMDYSSKDKDHVPDFLNQAVDYPRVVKFYNPHCPHCQAFAPQYVQFAKNFLGLASNSDHYLSALQTIQFHAISCLPHKELCRKENIRNYPQLKIIPAHTPSKDAVIITDYQLHSHTLARILGAASIQVPTPLQAIEPPKEEKSNHLRTKNGKRMRGKGPISSHKKMALLHKKPKVSTRSHLSLFPARTQQELYTDAYLSFYTTIQNNVFVESAGPLDNTRKAKLKAFLELLRDALPPWHIFQQLLHKLVPNLDRLTFHESVWSKAVEPFAPSTTDWSPACQKHGSPYTCGLWSLFHLVTVGATEYNRLALQEEPAMFATAKVAETLKDFIETFFLCQDCTQHFVQEYDDCRFGRCQRLHDKDAHLQSLPDWSQLPLWLVEMHNAVNVRLQSQKLRIRQAAARQQQEQRVLWPSLNECPACWLEENGAESRFHQTVLYKYLRLTYWPEDTESRAFLKDLDDGMYDEPPQPTSPETPKIDSTSRKPAEAVIASPKENSRNKPAKVVPSKATTPTATNKETKQEEPSEPTPTDRSRESTEVSPKENSRNRPEKVAPSSKATSPTATNKETKQQEAAPAEKSMTEEEEKRRMAKREERLRKKQAEARKNKMFKVAKGSLPKQETQKVATATESEIVNKLPEKKERMHTWNTDDEGNLKTLDEELAKYKDEIAKAKEKLRQADEKQHQLEMARSSIELEAVDEYTTPEEIFDPNEVKVAASVAHPMESVVSRSEDFASVELEHQHTLSEQILALFVFACVAIASKKFLLWQRLQVHLNGHVHDI